MLVRRLRVVDLQRVGALAAGIVLLSQVAARLPVLEVACNRCDRRGRLQMAWLLAKHEVNKLESLSGVHPGAFGDLVDELPVFAQRKTHDFCGLGAVLSEDRAIGGIVPGRKHFLNVQAVWHLPVQGAAVTSNPAAGSYLYSDSNGTPASGSATNTDGTAFLVNVPPGAVSINATKSGATFKAHSVKAKANTFTSTVITE